MDWALQRVGFQCFLKDDDIITFNINVLLLRNDVWNGDPHTHSLEGHHR